jgi:hypothetical protein
MSDRKDDAAVPSGAPRLPALTVPEEFGRTMRRIHSGELTALSQRETIKELRTASGLIIKIDDPKR